jgi:hypothetical protein
MFSRLRDFGNVFHEEFAVVGLRTHDIAMYKLAVAYDSEAVNEYKIEFHGCFNGVLSIS